MSSLYLPVNLPAGDRARPRQVVPLLRPHTARYQQQLVPELDRRGIALIAPRTIADLPGEVAAAYP